MLWQVQKSCYARLCQNSKFMFKNCCRAGMNQENQFIQTKNFVQEKQFLSGPRAANA